MILYGTAVCCREWVVSALDPVGRCGLCGEVPVKVSYEKGNDE